jgi:hypothetical protein
MFGLNFLARFESIVSILCSCGPLTYSDNECAKQLLYALDDNVWGMKITTLEESADFATRDTEIFLASINLINFLGKVIRIVMLLLPIKL